MRRRRLLAARGDHRSQQRSQPECGDDQVRDPRRRGAADLRVHLGAADAGPPADIDGTTQPGGAITLNGDGAGVGANGLVLGAGSDGSTIRSIGFGDFGGAAIRIFSSDNSIVGNDIGGALPNGTGISVQSGTGNHIAQNSIDHNIGLGIDPSLQATAPRRDADDAGSGGVDGDTVTNDLQNFTTIECDPGTGTWVDRCSRPAVDLAGRTRGRVLREPVVRCERQRRGRDFLGSRLAGSDTRAVDIQHDDSRPCRWAVQGGRRSRPRD